MNNEVSHSRDFHRQRKHILIESRRRAYTGMLDMLTADQTDQEVHSNGQEYHLRVYQRNGNPIKFKERSQTVTELFNVLKLQKI